MQTKLEVWLLTVTNYVYDEWSLKALDLSVPAAVKLGDLTPKVTLQIVLLRKWCLWIAQLPTKILKANQEQTRRHSIAEAAQTQFFSPTPNERVQFWLFTAKLFTTTKTSYFLPISPLVFTLQRKIYASALVHLSISSYMFMNFIRR